LVQRDTAYAYGAAESSYRTGEFDEFREDYRFTGKEDDVEVGLIYFGARYYAPLLQRWISADPLAVHSPGSADLNFYAYVHGRVFAAVDPVGLNDVVRGAMEDVVFSDNVRRHLPVRFIMSIMAPSNDLRYMKGDNAYWPTFNAIALTQSTLDGMRGAGRYLAGDPGLGSALSGTGTLYHESTHAYLWIHRDRPDVAKLVKTGVAYYTDAPLDDGGKATDRTFG
jgi:RHS repeat-associated protein